MNINGLKRRVEKMGQGEREAIEIKITRNIAGHREEGDTGSLPVIKTISRVVTIKPINRK